eukprot:208831-Rhodomonas_salina.7
MSSSLIGPGSTQRDFSTGHSTALVLAASGVYLGVDDLRSICGNPNGTVSGAASMISTNASTATTSGGAEQTCVVESSQGWCCHMSSPGNPFD